MTLRCKAFTCTGNTNYIYALTDFETRNHGVWNDQVSRSINKREFCQHEAHYFSLGSTFNA